MWISFNNEMLTIIGRQSIACYKYTSRCLRMFVCKAHTNNINKDWYLWIKILFGTAPNPITFVDFFSCWCHSLHKQNIRIVFQFLLNEWMNDWPVHCIIVCSLNNRHTCQPACLPVVSLVVARVFYVKHWLIQPISDNSEVLMQFGGFNGRL